MSVFKSDYGTEKQTITITLTSLASAATQASTVVDNTTNLYLDALVQISALKTGASGTSANGFVNIYAYGTVDAADSLYPEGISGTDAGITLTVPTNLRLIGTLNAVVNATTYTSEPMSVAAAFGGILPEKWGIAIENQTGHALDTSAGGSVFYQGIWGQSV